MRQRAFTIVSELAPEKRDSLTQLSRPIGDAIRSNSTIRFEQIARLHYCTFLVIADADGSPPVLVFEGNIDGEVRPFLLALMQEHGDFLREVYEHCVDAPPGGSNDAMVEYLLAHNVAPSAFFIAFPGWSLAEVQFEARLWRHLQTYLQTHAPRLRALNAAQIREELRTVLQADPEWRQSLTGVPVPWQSRVGVALFVLVALIVLTIALPLLPLILGYLVWLRSAETRDRARPLRWDLDALRRLQDREDRQPQNHLTAITYVKPGLMRLVTLRLVLSAINLLACLVATKGKLAKVHTIHFARWLIIPGKASHPHRLLFLSNYDGSLEHYLNEFIDGASDGLTAVWSNTEHARHEGFPDTAWLIRRGAKAEQLFKAYVRAGQREELIWYSAYPDLSASNIANNRELRRGIARTPRSVEAWLSRL